MAYLLFPKLRPGLRDGAGRDGAGVGRNDRGCDEGGDAWRPNDWPVRSPPGVAYFELLYPPGLLAYFESLNPPLLANVLPE